MLLPDLQALVGDLVNDPMHERYSTSAINTELENSQSEWNVEAHILTDTAIITVVAGTRRYALSNLQGSPIAFTRATHKGLPLKKRSKSFFDLFSGGSDWTAVTGTPTNFLVEIGDPALQVITVYPIPTDNDAGANLVVEYVKMHTALSSDTDAPFNSSVLTEPYHYGLCYSAAYKLLLRDPNPENALKAQAYKKIADGVKANVVQVFSALEKEEPYRLRSDRIGVRRRSLRTV